MSLISKLFKSSAFVFHRRKKVIFGWTISLLEDKCDALYVSITVPEIVFDISQSLLWLICSLPPAQTSEIRVRSRSHTDRQNIPAALWGKTNWKGYLYDTAADGHVHAKNYILSVTSVCGCVWSIIEMVNHELLNMYACQKQISQSQRHEMVSVKLLNTHAQI